MRISEGMKDECWILESGMILKVLLLLGNEKEGTEGDEQRGSELGPFLTTNELRPRLLRNCVT